MTDEFTDVNVTHTLAADNFAGSSWTLLVDGDSHRVAIGGGASPNLFTVGNQSPTDITFIVNRDAAYVRGKTATDTSELHETQAVLALYGYRWDGLGSKEVRGGVAFRATDTGGDIIFDVPGVEVVTFRGDTQELEVSGDSPTVGVRITDSSHLNVLATYAKDFLKISPSPQPLPTPSAALRGQIRRTEGTNDHVYICLRQGSSYVWKEL